MSSSWQFWIDVGGTFTDCFALSPDGKRHYSKVLSSSRTKGSIANWIDDRAFSTTDLIGRNEADSCCGAKIDLISDSGTVVLSSLVVRCDATTGQIEFSAAATIEQLAEIVGFELDYGFHSPILAIRRILGCKTTEQLPPCRVFLGTTRGTNALLTKSGARTAILTSRGFRDMLTIGDQARPHLFDLVIRKPKPLFESSVEISERVLADGTVELAPDASEVRHQIQELQSAGIESIAVCFMHGYLYPDHEKLVGQVAREVGFVDVRLSHEVAPLIKIISRGETTVLDAFLNPVLGRYLDEIEASLSKGSQLRLMTSSGGLVSRKRFSGKDSVLSGPAGGAVGAARVAEQAGFERMIGFDMGGTSTDVSRYDGKFEREFESVKAGVRIVTPMMSIETVASGGGSICWFDGTKLAVGPKSAGADPGPACYGRGGPLTVTDMNLMLGRLRVDQFPFSLDRNIVEQRLSKLCEELQTSGHNYLPHELATGFLEIANHNMSAAIRSISVAKGYDPQEYVLVSFGGAGSQHCCAVAANLGITRILDHPQSSILSAVGIGLAEQTSHAVESVLQVLGKSTITELTAIFERLEARASQELISDGVELDQITTSRSLDLRYVGTDASLSVPCPSGNDFALSFTRAHKRLYGYTQDRAIEILAARVEANSRHSRMPQSSLVEDKNRLTTKQWQPIWCDGIETVAALFRREELASGNVVVGPAIVADWLSTTIIDSGWEASTLADGQLLIERIGDDRKASIATDSSHSIEADPVRLEIFNNHFSSIARQMGIVLQKTSTSVNVKERLDFSCAVFGAAGDLVVNAPHIPVHLGAMSETVRAIIQLNDRVTSGDVFVTNDPYAGGSHLPDVTVVTPVFGDEPQPVFWVASRSHHAEIGGKAPGSMPAEATRLGEEGVLIQNFKLVDGGQERFEELQEILSSGDYPSRSPEENIADISAQVAANRTGESDLLQLVQQYGLPTVQNYMCHIQDAAETKARSALRNMENGRYTFEDSLDNGATIRLAITKENSQIEFDFAGTDPVLEGNLNANRAIVSAAVMYVMRCLIADDIPLNEGVMNPVRIKLNDCFLNPSPALDPNESPAIVGGNVETSQRIVDVILGALGLAAASCGTMNNWLIGNKSFGYYETVGGGSGATDSSHGANAVHTHMTNTRLTDPEILETRYPVVLREFSIRPESGGQGRHIGGNGMHREIEFLDALTLSLLTNRRIVAPFGLDGGQPGKCGENLLLRLDSLSHEVLPSQCEVLVQRGDRLVLLTPGGGGYGAMDS